MRINGFVTSVLDTRQVPGAMYVLVVEEPVQSDDSSSYSMTLSEFEEDRWYNPTSLSNDVAEIESVQRLIKYIRVNNSRVTTRRCRACTRVHFSCSHQVGNQTATAIALAALVDFDLRDECTQGIVIATGGTELLINLLETDHHECRVIRSKTLFPLPPLQYYVITV